VFESNLSFHSFSLAAVKIVSISCSVKSLLDTKTSFNGSGSEILKWGGVHKRSKKCSHADSNFEGENLALM